MDALEVLKKMHTEADSAFKKLERADRDDREALWDKLRSELVLHEQIEERFVYDPASKDTGRSLQKFHQHHEEEVREMAETVEKIGDLDPASDKFVDMIKQMHETLGHHIEEEESDFWPAIRESWGQEELKRAAGPVEAAKNAAGEGAGMREAMAAATQAAGRR